MAKPSTLGRAAAGLPRYYMDTGWWRSRRFAGLDLAAVGLMSCIVSYCTEHATDGELPADVEDLAAAVGLRARDVKRALPALLERDALVRRGGHLVVPGWADHNPTKAEIESYTAERSALGSKGNHVRHHVGKGIVKPGCEWCDQGKHPDTDRSSDRSSDPDSDRSSGPEPVAKRSHGMGWDGMGEPSSSSTTSAIGDRPSDDEEIEEAQQPPPTDLRITQAARILGRRDHEQAKATGTRIGDDTAYRDRCTTKRATSPELLELAQAEPDLTAAELAERIAPPPPPSPALASIERNARRARGDACPNCDDAGMVLDADGFARPCPCTRS